MYEVIAIFWLFKRVPIVIVEGFQYAGICCYVLHLYAGQFCYILELNECPEVTYTVVFAEP